jgi:hypothetical protein
MRRLLLLAALVLAVITFFAARTLREDRAETAVRARTERGELPAIPVVDPRSTSGPAPGSPATGESEASGAHVRGTVRGPAGVVWGAHVIAYKRGGLDVLAERWTSPEGGYEIGVDPDVAIDLAVETAPGTGLLPKRTNGILVRAGEEWVEDFTLERGATLRGRLVDPDGNAVQRVGIEAVPADPSGRTYSSSRPDPAATSAKDGTFEIRGLDAGRVVLDVTDPEWMFPEPVSAMPDGPDLSLVVVPALTVETHVVNLETGEPMPAFPVRVVQADRVLLEAEGKDGAFLHRGRFPGERWDRAFTVEVTAAGFLPASRLGSDKRWIGLVPKRDVNTTVRVSFDDGQPYHGDLVATITAMRVGEQGVAEISFERVREGVYRGALPWGRWELALRPLGCWGIDEFKDTAEVGPEKEAELSLVLPAGGTVVLRPAPGAEYGEAYLQPTDRAGRSWYCGVRREGTRVEGIPKGKYQVGYERMVQITPDYFGRQTVWLREVTLDVGTIEEFEIPAFLAEER